MRYSIMLQLTSAITLVLVGSAALFTWIQNRTVPETSEVSNTGDLERFANELAAHIEQRGKAILPPSESLK